MTTPKSQLLGQTLAGGWHLVEKIEPAAGATGSNFGVGYRATNAEGHTAFVKAIDFVDAMNAADPLGEMTKLVSVANFEKEVAEYCSQNGMTKVIHYIGHEYLSLDTNPLNRVSCLIMESGDADLRRLVNANGLSTCSWNLQVIHDVCQAIEQLHKGGIAHHDIKPSNIISIKRQNKQVMKVGDLGRVIRKDRAGPFDHYHWPGDRRYSPPEVWYNYHPQGGWNNTRVAADAYMLGSLIVYLFTNTTLQALVGAYIPNNFRPGIWNGGFDENLIPVLIDAHTKVLHDHLKPNLLPEISDEMMEITLCLTHPSPESRGDKKARKQLQEPVGIDRIRQKIARIMLTCAAIERGRGRK